MARAADIWRITCPSCNTGRVLASDGGGSIPPVGPFAIHDCFGAAVHHIDDIHTHVFGELSLTRALHIGDFLFQTDKAFGAAISFYEIAERLGEHDPLIHSIRAKLQIARSLAEHQPRPAPR